MTSPKEVAYILEKGAEIRSLLEKKLNLLQSRSHSIAVLSVKRGSGEGSSSPKQDETKLVFCDLAGSEKISKSLTENQRLQESIIINNSFSAISKVVCTLNSEDAYDAQIKYNDSKLTMALKETLKPTSNVTFIVTVHPTESNFEEVVSSLRYSEKLKASMKKASSRASLLLPQKDEEATTNERLLGKLNHENLELRAEIENLKRAYKVRGFVSHLIQDKNEEVKRKLGLPLSLEQILHAKPNSKEMQVIKSYLEARDRAETL